MQFSSFVREIIKLSWPTVILTLSQLGMGTVDTLISARVSLHDLAGVALGTAIWSPLVLCISAVISILTVMNTQFYARQNLKNATSMFQQATLIAIFLGIIAMAIPASAFLWLPYIGAAPDTTNIAIDYLLYASPSLFCATLFQCLRSDLEARKLVKPAMYALLGGFIINIPVNLLCVFGLFEWSGMGGAGCGLATSFSFALMSCILYLYWQKHRSHDKVKVRIDFKQIKHFLRLGIPLGAMTFMEIGMFSLITLYIARFGTEALAAHQIVMNFTSLTFMLPMSVASILSLLIAEQIAHNADARRLQTLILAGLSVGGGCIMVSSTFIAVFPEFLASLYAQDQQVIQIASLLLILAAVYQIFDALQSLLVGMLKGLHLTAQPFWIMGIGAWLFCFPVGMILTEYFVQQGILPVQGFYWGLLIGLPFICASLYWLWHIKINLLFPVNKLQSL